MTEAVAPIDHIKYHLDDETYERIENIFQHHPPINDQLARYQHLRDEGKALALLIVGLTPKSPEQASALAHLETAVTCANAAIARHEKPPVADPSYKYKYAGCYGGHDPNELPNSEEVGGDPIPQSKRERNVIPA